MSIESEVFKKKKIHIEKLLEYGFEKIKESYVYFISMKNDFKASIVVDEKMNVSGKIFDQEEEYTNFRISNLKGEFVNSVREEYKSILQDIADRCCEKLYFITPQANRITNEVIKLYHNEPEFLWESSPDHGIFRNPDNQKWYALIAYIEKSKLVKNALGKTEIINLKIKEDERESLLKRNGFYLAWHMNKKSWITIILDDTVSDSEVMELIKKSHIYTSS
ncbi:MAG: MmcQ/YjbR family DNA-binding protein, partial [Anaeroplasmataceae bacterium]|nr:MmcQ/YjbR family DNA-binding protein [Anaeroplasmataceae bacterium]